MTFNITGDDQALRRAELQRYRAGDQRVAPPATGAPPDWRKARTLAQVWGLPVGSVWWEGRIDG